MQMCAGGEDGKDSCNGDSGNEALFEWFIESKY